MLDKNDLFWDDSSVTRHSDSKNSRALGSNIANEYYKQIMEITINVPQGNMSLVEHTRMYNELWNHIKTSWKSTKDLYFVEYCKSGQAHIHGFVEFELHQNTPLDSDEALLREFNKGILKKLPLKLYKLNIKKQHINVYFRSLKCPAVCLNLKNTLDTNWENYMRKNAL